MPHVLEVKLHAHVGHRLMHHSGKCKNLHGHQYHFVIRFGMPDIERERGMALDFSDAKAIANKIVDNWDHGFLYNKADPVFNPRTLADLAVVQDSAKLFPMDGDPTAENISQLLYFLLKQELRAASCPAWVREVEVWETLTCCAKYTELEVPPATR